MNDKEMQMVLKGAYDCYYNLVKWVNGDHSEEQREKVRIGSVMMSLYYDDVFGKDEEK